MVSGQWLRPREDDMNRVKLTQDSVFPVEPATDLPFQPKADRFDLFVGNEVCEGRVGMNVILF